MERIRGNQRIILIVVVALALLCLVGVLIYNILTGGAGEDVAAEPSPTAVPTQAPTEEGPEEVITPEEATATPTRVVGEEVEGEVMAEATTEPTLEPTTEPATATPSPTPARQASSATSSSALVAAKPQVRELLANGDFEQGFGNTGVGLQWGSFKTEGAAISFSSEAPGPFVKTGSSAQRISISQAAQADQYAGIYQQVEVIPGQTYTLKLFGQIRSPFGDIQASSYGYRMEYAIDYNGGTNWGRIPEQDWVELPWDEQRLDTAEVKFLGHAASVEATSDQLTLFVRAWNKWPHPALAEYTLDSLSLVGSASAPITAAPVASSAAGGSTGTGEALVDKGLPTTGTGDETRFIQDGRFWGAVVILLLLAVGAIYRARWNY